MGAIDDLNDAIDADPDISVDATWTDATGADHPLRVVFMTVVETREQMGHRANLARACMTVRTRDMQESAAGETVTIGGDTYDIASIKPGPHGRTLVDLTGPQ